jgi:glycosyltransferase involved in cell wall biosynthesis
MKHNPPYPSLGVVAVSHNEETDLPAFLAHLLPWVDEIIIIDDGSNDRSAQLALAAGPKVRFIVSQRNPQEGFSDQRNKGIQASTSDWLLHMDIDERVPAELAAEISIAIQDPAKEAYRYRRLNFFLHRPMRGGGWQKWNNIQLARRHLTFAGRIHERIRVPDPTRVGQLKSFMWHLNDADYPERIRKSTSYLQVLIEEWMQAGFRARWFHFLFYPAWYFVRLFLLMGGWRDGMTGLVWAVHCASGAGSLLAVIWDKQHHIPRESIEAKLRERWTQAQGRNEPDPRTEFYPNRQPRLLTTSRNE